MLGRTMLYMVVERYTKGPRPVYERAATQGRMLPEGLRYVDSWVVDEPNLDRCFQLMVTVAWHGGTTGGELS
jgi:hypothetical protein